MFYIYHYIHFHIFMLVKMMPRAIFYPFLNLTLFQRKFLALLHTQETAAVGAGRVVSGLPGGLLTRVSNVRCCHWI